MPVLKTVFTCQLLQCYCCSICISKVRVHIFCIL